MYGKFTKLRVLTIHPVDVHSHFIVSLTNVLKEFRDAVFVQLDGNETNQSRDSYSPLQVHVRPRFSVRGMQFGWVSPWSWCLGK